MNNYDLIIVGGGSAGLASAISASDNGTKNILLLEKDDFLGGILLQCVHNGFGLQEFKEELCGPEYAERFENEIRKRKNIIIKTGAMVTKINPDLSVEYSSSNDGYIKCYAKAIICATGCSERTRGAINIDGSRPSGVMTAGLAQHYINIDGYMVGKKIFILGSGDIGLIMARRLTLEGAKVLGVAEIMPYSNGLNRNIVQCLNDFNIPLYLSHTVKEIKGKNRIESIILSKVDDNLKFISGTEQEIEVDTLLLSVGLIPSNPLLEEIGVEINPITKGPIVDENYMTSIPGIFACGNSLHVHDLVDYVTNEGRVVGECASLYISNSLKREFNVKTINGEGVNYVIPSMLGANQNKNVTLKFRVKKPYKESFVIIKNNDVIIKKIKKLYLLPAEMENITINLKNVNSGQLIVEVESL